LIGHLSRILPQKTVSNDHTIDICTEICYRSVIVSLRENIQLFYHIDINEYLEALRKKHGLEGHPSKDGLYLLDDHPFSFHRPQWNEDHLFILGTNLTPLSPTLVQVLVENPEFVPPETRVVWTQEQEIVFEGTLDGFRDWLNDE